MSLEQKIEELTKAVNENTAALKALSTSGGQAAAPAAGGEPPANPAAKGKAGRKGKTEQTETAASAATTEADPFGEEAADPFGEDGGAEKVYTAEEIKALILKVRETKGADEALKIISARGVKTIGQIAEKDYPAVVADAKKLSMTL